MKAIQFCKAIGVTHKRLEIILARQLKSDDIITELEQDYYYKSLNTERKKIKLKKPKTNKIGKNSPNPFNKDNLKVRAWIVRK